MSEPIQPSALYKIEAVSKLLGCGKTNVYDLVNSRALAHVPIGSGKKGIRIQGSDILSFIQSRKVGGPRSSLTEKLRADFAKLV
jgi:Helix-turn-helix domain